MFTSKKLPVAHKDLIHDVSYDFYGRRLATCSSDQTVQVIKRLHYMHILHIVAMVTGMGYGQ